MLWYVALTVSAMLAAQAGAEPKPIANLGTLTCSLDPSGAGNDGPGLTCVFEPIAGVQANFVGRAETDAADQAMAKMVFVWSVVAPSMDTPAQNIEGHYLGLTGEQEGPPTLIGGLNNEILLKPTIDRASEDSKVTIRTLELRLDAVKT